MKVRWKLLGLGTAASVAALAAAIGSHATPFGTNGLLVYQTRDGSQGVLFTIRPDGTARRRIASAPGDAAPDWSPDGSRIVFATEHPSGPLFCSITLMNADGSGLADLSGNET